MNGTNWWQFRPRGNSVDVAVLSRGEVVSDQGPQSGSIGVFSWIIIAFLTFVVLGVMVGTFFGL